MVLYYSGGFVLREGVNDDNASSPEQTCPTSYPEAICGMLLRAEVGYSRPLFNGSLHRGLRFRTSRSSGTRSPARNAHRQGSHKGSQSCLCMCIFISVQVCVYMYICIYVYVYAFVYANAYVFALV